MAFKKPFFSGFILVLGFLVLILLGSALLMLPVSHRDGVDVRYIDALFVSVTSVCVTGLTPVVIASTFSAFGYVVIAVLIQVGGLGFAIIAVGVMAMLNARVAGGNQQLVKEALSLPTTSEILPLASLAVKITVIIEALGALGLYFVFLQDHESATALGYAVFHSVSAFNNAGIDLLGISLEGYASNVWMNLIISALIVLGGLGFFVYGNLLLTRKKKRVLSIHTKIVLSVTAVLIVSGTVLLWLFSDMTWLESLFLSVSSRTAGFDTVPMIKIPMTARFLVIILMFIGASPGSTGGGIKTTTIFTLVRTFLSIPLGREPNAFKRKISQDSIIKAMLVLSVSIGLIIVSVQLLLMFEGENSYPLDYLMFEAVSAFATVGLSCNLTPSLTDPSKITLILLMFIGRLGPLTITSLFRRKAGQLAYLEDKIMIG